MNRVKLTRGANAAASSRTAPVISPNRGAAHGLPGSPKTRCMSMTASQGAPALGAPVPGAPVLAGPVLAGPVLAGVVARPSRPGLRRGRGARGLLGPDGRPAEGQRADEAENQGDKDAHVGERPGAGLAAQAERAEQVALPGQPAGE